MGCKKEQIGRNCPYCGAVVTYDEYFCRACHKRIFDQNQLDAPSTLAPEMYVVGLRKLYLSVLMGLAGVGLAQFYNGDTLKGLAFLCAFLFVSFGNLGGTQFHTVLYFGIWIAAMGEGIFSAWRINTFQRTCSGKSYWFWAEFCFLTLIVLLHLATGIPEMAYLGKFFPVVNVWMMR